MNAITLAAPDRLHAAGHPPGVRRWLIVGLTGLALAIGQGTPAGGADPSERALPPGAVRQFGGRPSGTPLRFALTPDGSRLVLGDRTGRIEVWDVATGRLMRRLAEGQDGGRALVCLAVSPDGRQVAAGRGHCDLWVYPIDGGEPPRKLICPLRLDGGWMKCLAWAPDGKSLFADGSGMTVSRVRVADGETVWGILDENFPWLALRPDGRVVVKTLWDGLQFLDASTGQESAPVPLMMTQEQGPVGPVTWAPDGEKLALILARDTIVVCDHAGRERLRFTAGGAGRRPGQGARGGDGHGVGAPAFSPDGKWIVAQAGGPSVRVWEVASGKLVMCLDGSAEGGAGAVVSPDGRSMFAWGDGLVYQWDLTPRPYPRTRQQPGDLWAAAAEVDPAVAVPAAWALVTGSEEDRGFVADRLPSFAPARPEEIARWLTGLDAPAFADREAATRALTAQGRGVERQLREALHTTRSPEVRRRAEAMLARLGNTCTAEELRALRLVQACELSATPAARALLRRWAAGAPGALLTEDAAAARARLDRRAR